MEDQMASVVILGAEVAATPPRPTPDREDAALTSKYPFSILKIHRNLFKDDQNGS